MKMHLFPLVVFLSSLYNSHLGFCYFFVIQNDSAKHEGRNLKKCRKYEIAPMYSWVILQVSVLVE